MRRIALFRVEMHQRAAVGIGAGKTQRVDRVRFAQRRGDHRPDDCGLARLGFSGDGHQVARRGHGNALQRVDRHGCDRWFVSRQPPLGEHAPKLVPRRLPFAQTLSRGDEIFDIVEGIFEYNEYA